MVTSASAPGVMSHTRPVRGFDIFWIVSVPDAAKQTTTSSSAPPIVQVSLPDWCATKASPTDATIGGRSAAASGDADSTKSVRIEKDLRKIYGRGAFIV